MKLEFWLKEFRKAILTNDYNRQSEVAEKLLWFEEVGMVNDQMIIDIIRLVT